jgi:cell division ATPase FtsA
MVEVAERVFNAPVRIGAPSGFNGLAHEITQPLDAAVYAAAMGLVLYGLRSESGVSGSRNQNRRMPVQPIRDRVKSFFGIRR